jgi:hypothetical protein
MVKDFLSERTAHIRVGNTISSKKVTKGCPQGSVSSPTIWNIIISDLITLLSNETNVKTVVCGDPHYERLWTCNKTGYRMNKLYNGQMHV